MERSPEDIAAAEAHVRALLGYIGDDAEREGLLETPARVVAAFEEHFAGYNEVYAEYFSDIQAARTTLSIRALPTPIAVELKVIATVE